MCLNVEKNLTLLLAINKGAEQPAHPRSLISDFVFRYLKSKVTILQMFFCGLQRLHPCIRIVYAKATSVIINLNSQNIYDSHL